MRVLSFILLINIVAAFASQSNHLSRSYGLPSTSSTNKNYKINKSIDNHRSFALQASSSKTTTSTVVKKGGDATIATSTFNLAKSIIGAGVLSLPSGVAFYSDSPTALIPASIITIVMGLVSAYSFSIIGKACEQHSAESFQDVWAKSVNPNTAWIISSAITATCLLASLAYSIIIGDSFTSLAQTFNLPLILTKRTNVILFISTLVLLPLCSLKSLSALAPFSILGLAGTLYTAIFMAIRYFDGSYLPGGKFFAALPAVGRPIFNSRGGIEINKIFVLVSMLSTSFVAHFIAPRFYNELKDKSVSRFNQVVSYSFLSAIVTFIFMTVTGFLTFGGATAGFVLNNYASFDGLATFARLAIGLALLTGYPFTFSALRDGILDLLNVTGSVREGLVPYLTFGLLGLVTGLALVLKDVGFVVSVSGALFGCSLMFIVPAIMNINNIKSFAKSTDKALSKGNKVEIALNYLLAGSGVVMGGLGVAISVLKQIGKL
eukprot:gene26613-34860_t